MVPLNKESTHKSETQHGLPTALSVHQVSRSKHAEQRASNKHETIQRKAAQKAKSDPFNNP
jgi:hypothetical protein